MAKTNNYSFQEKIKSFIVYAFMLKLVYVLALAISEESFSILFGGIFLIFIIILILFFIVGALFDRWSANGSSGYSGGNSYGVDTERFNAIRDKYQKLSDDFVEKKQYRKAAFVQLRLLQNPYNAAEILKDAKLYNDAAVLYLKRCSNKTEAANCYRLAKNYKKSINLYKELEAFEIVGDIYSEKGDYKTAKNYYQTVIDDYVENNQYVKASLVYRKKMHDTSSGQSILIKGWKENKDAENCLNNYFAHFASDTQLLKEVKDVNSKLVNSKNDFQFLSVMKHLYKKHQTLEDQLQDMAYTIIAKHPKHTAYVSMLKTFVKEDKQITKDIIKYRLKHNRQ